jgi:predicted CXXCH cytochrome family protein
MKSNQVSKKVLQMMGAAAITTLFSVSAQAQITGTKHNLSTGQTAGNRVSTGTNQICVFCHTPHGSDTSAAVPLWNKKLPSTSYTTYAALNTSTLDGEILSVGSVSLACLSCHDGTQAMDNMMNAPGSGGFDANGASPAGWAWTGANQSSGKIGAGLITNIGADLRNDHPIGIEYCGGGISGSGTTVSGSCTDTDFIGPGQTTTSDGRTATLRTASVNSNQVFWIDLDGNSKRSKGDVLLYTRTFAGSVSRPSVECGSCHDPHIKSADTTVEVNFMRVTTDGSKICLSCHVK